MTGAMVPHHGATPRPSGPPAFSARRPLVYGFFALAVLIGGLFGWGTFASIVSAVTAAGYVEVETRDQTVEHIDGGTVGAILVRDGDRVEAGAVLLRLDDSQLRSEAALLEAQAIDLAARRNRLEAEFRDASEIGWDPKLARRAENDAAVGEILDGQQRLFEARRSLWAGQTAQLRERIGQTRKQIAGLEAQGKAVARQGTFLTRELEAHRSLYKDRMTPLHTLLELEREAARLEGEAGEIAARIAAARGRIAEIEIQILQVGTQRIEIAQDRARGVRAEENQVLERLANVGVRLGRMEVRAPVAGEVYGMTVFALGEVVRPGEPILKIVPEGSELVVMARLDPIHVDQVYVGQDAMLMFSAFPARVTPSFSGRIQRVSGDALQDERTGVSWFEIEIAIGEAIESSGVGFTDMAGRVAQWLPGGRLRDALASLPGTPAPGSSTGGDGTRALVLAPGMPVEVRIRTGQRSPLSYLTKPLADYFSRSLREE